MSPLLKRLLTFIVVAVLVVSGFLFHPLIGWGVVVIFIGASAYMNRATFYAARGNMAFAQGDEKQALEWMEKAYRTKRADPLQIAGYAYLLNRAGKPHRAAELMRELLEKPLPDPVRLQASINLATANWLMGKKREAYETLAAFYPEYKTTQLYGTLGYYKLLLGEDLEQVLAFNLEAYDYNSDDMTILDNLAQTCYLLGRYDEAQQYYEKVMEKRPKNADSYYYHALTLKALGRLEEAREQIEQARYRKFSLISPVTHADVERAAAELGMETDGSGAEDARSGE